MACARRPRSVMGWDESRYHAPVACEHVGPPELIEMAERHLREASINEDEWPGHRFRWSENVADGTWASVMLEIERRNGDWIVTRLDRSAERISEDDAGFREI